MIASKGKHILFLSLLTSLIVLVNYQSLKIEYLKFSGYQVFENHAMEFSNIENYSQDFVNPKYWKCGMTSTNIILLNGRNSTFESMKSGIDYTRSLFSELEKFSRVQGVNFIFFEIGSDRYWIGDQCSDQIDLYRLELFLKTLDVHDTNVIIGMSYGGIISEYIAYFHPELKIISIGGSVRENEFSFSRFSDAFSDIKVNINQNVTHVIGSRDGNFENYIRKENDSIFVYKGHHYITDEAISIVKGIIINEI
ncbi:hypothetical protein N8991_03515 [Schleiferiaceae bacterium]|nr:hypothetical protein [Schleiferiaceae bacterium]